jgi:hypothetical protein
MGQECGYLPYQFAFVFAVEESIQISHWQSYDFAFEKPLEGTIFFAFKKPHDES